MERRVRVVVALGLAAVVAVLFLPPLPQDPAYHAFADRRRLLGIPNAFNVLSNAPFVLVGALGLALARRREALGERAALLTLFTAIALTGFGSAYYHLGPDTVTLFWDRLPMTLVFMSLLAITIGERISLRAGRRLLPVLLAVGAGSVLYWLLGELAGVGDLRAYALVQFFPMLAIPLMLLLFPPLYTRGGDLVGALAWYALAKVFEALDAQVFAAGQLVSGHTLKHLAAAVAMAWILMMVKRRRPVVR